MPVFVLLASILIYFSYRSLLGGFAYFRFFQAALARRTSDYTPSVTIIAPCKGFEAGLEATLKALFELDYPNYEVLFVVDDAGDGALPVIREVSEGRRARILVAGSAAGESQKVHNLRAASAEITEETEVIVFVDSDVRPAAGWLGALVQPLEDENIGAATGYRWFIADRGGLASAVRSVWNASVASALGPDDAGNFCWGGSTAIRRKLFESLDVSERWRGTLSDDFALTRILKESGRPIRFVPQALTASVEDCTFGELVEFTTRQMKITRVYSPHLWKSSLMGSALFNLVMIWGLWIIFTSPAGSFAWWFSVAGLSLVWGFSIGKAYIRLRAALLALPAYRAALRAQMPAQLTLWAVTPALFLYNSAAAALPTISVRTGECSM